MADIVLPETNLTGDDIRDMLNEYGGNVGDDFTDYFTEDANINMWSKFKPIVIEYINFINLWENEAYKTNGCGITIPYFSHPSDIREALEEGDGMWTYTPPSGGEREPRRLGDFRRYCPVAINPIGSFEGSYVARRVAENDSISITIELTVGSDDPYNLTLSDLNVAGIEVDLSDMYLGVYLVDLNSNNYYFCTCESEVGTDEEFTIDVPLNYDEEGEFMAYLFLSTSVQYVGDERDGEFITLNKVGQEITIKRAGTLYVINASAVADSAGSKGYTCDVWIENNDSTSKTFTNIYCQIQHYIDGEWQNEGTAKLVSSSVTVSAGNDKNISKSLTHNYVFDGEDLKKQRYRIYAYSETPSIIGSPGAFEEMAL